ncbi:MAG TPA: DUF6036 family nucleotidyltransferase [Candidatus Eisenbacteria bacterium]|nr:DUF6036 family nucleotidyltransferase [Candidatus Eisenbacteria bacterium]
MERRSIEVIVDTMNRGGARYLVVGGLAVVAHGFVRFTADIDLVLDPEPAAMRSAIDALSGLGYRPRAPVPFSEFADPEKRRAWLRDKQLTVFSVFSPEHPATEIDLFVETPFDFERAYADADRFEVAPGIEATFVGINDLIAMKRKAGRPQDLQDVAELESQPRRREEAGG